MERKLIGKNDGWEGLIDAFYLKAAGGCTNPRSIFSPTLDSRQGLLLVSSLILPVQIPRTSCFTNPFSSSSMIVDKTCT
jgi:hypothetical protein